MQKENDPQMPITSQEEKEIHRVFELLCDYNQKSRIKEEIKELNSWLIATKAKISQQINAGHIIIDEKIEANNLTTIARLDELKKELQEIENKADKKITAVDIAEKLRRLKKQATKKEIEEMLWEVDENLDGCIDWAEFRLMYNRNIMDKTGLEPSRMFNLVQFLIYDVNENGCVSVDETMNILYARFGRAKMEVKLKELFGEDMHESGRQGGEISFSVYLAAVEKTQVNTFLSTTKGKIILSKGGFGKTFKKNLTAVK